MYRKFVGALVTVLLVIFAITGRALSDGHIYAVGVSHDDVEALKGAVMAALHIDGTGDWIMSVSGRYALVHPGCGPGACDEAELIRTAGKWSVACFQVEGKNIVGTCVIPEQTKILLEKSALSNYCAKRPDQC